MENWSQEQWESLCDGCGKCCLHKLEDEDTGEVYLTDVACRFLDLKGCYCTVYSDRFAKVPDCVDLAPHRRDVFEWLPESCAYRLIADGKPLPEWHHLVSGSHETIHLAQSSVRDKVISELQVSMEDLESRIIMKV